MQFKVLSLLLVLCVCWSCFSQETGNWEIVSPELLKAGGLEIVWQDRLAIKRGENLDRLFLVGGRIYALSSTNYIFALNKENGEMAFNRPFAAPGLPVLGLELYKDQLISVIGNSLTEINPEFGTEKSVRSLKFGVTCPIARDSWYYYIGGSDRRMHALRADDKVHIFEVSAENESMVTSIVADDRFVVFGTDTGNVIRLQVAGLKRNRLWEFDAAGGVIGPMIQDGKSLFFASKDTNLYKLNMITGALDWKYSVGAALERRPVVTEKMVYQYVRDKGLAALDKESGRLIWQLAQGEELLSEANSKAYVITKTGKLTVMDNDRAKELYSINFAGVSGYVTNIDDTKIYIANKDGRIACLKPIK